MDTLVVRYSKKLKNFYVAITIFCTVFSALAGYLVFKIGFDAFAGKLVIIWCVSTAIIVLVAAQLPIMTISDNGLKIGLGMRPIPGDEIEKVSIGTYLWSKMLFIKAKAPRQTIRKRIFSRMWYLFFGTDDDHELMISMSFLELTSDQICTMIRDRLPSRMSE